MQNEERIQIVNSELISSKIYEVRGQKVMLDSDLAQIYGYSTKDFNRQVKNNEAKFDSDFRFQLTKDEFDDLRCKNSTSSWGGTRYLPYVFTEQGIYMLMTVLRGDLAIAQSKALIRIFKQMKDVIVSNHYMIDNTDVAKLTVQTMENMAEIARIREQMVTKTELAEFVKDFSNELLKREFLIMNGETLEADVAYTSIYRLAKRTIYIVDDYIGVGTLALLKNAPDNVSIIVFSDNRQRCLHRTELDDFTHEYPNLNISFQTTNGAFHDRYIILDYGTDSEAIYHCGASSKDAGKKVTSITKISDCTIYHTLIDRLLSNPTLVI